MEWDDARLVLVIARARTLHDAGAQLGLDASTVSRRLAQLEARLKVRLFARTRDGLRTTPAADRVLPHAEAMEREAAALAHDIRYGESRIAGNVRLATTESFARMLVHGGLLALRDAHPDLALELIGGNRPVDLARGEADIAVRFSALRQPSLRARCLATTGVGLFASAAYRRGHGAVHSLRDHDVLLPSGELAKLPEVRWLSKRPGVHVALRSNSMPALVAAAVAGYGIVPLPLGWGDNEPGLERVLALDALPRRKIWLVTHEATSQRPAVRVVVAHVIAVFERLFA